MLTLAARDTKSRRTKAGPERPDYPKEALKYAFTVPDSWNEPQTTAMDALRDATQALRPMLAELTGRVVLRQLEKLN